MITPVVMPQLGLEVTEGTVAAIHVDVGASVAQDEPLLELETDKALTEVVAPRAGVVARIDVVLGDTVEVGATLIVLVDELGEPVVPAAAASVRPVTASPTRPARPREPVPVLAAGRSEPSRNEHGRLRSAPVARRAAEHLGIELSSVTGTGPRGRITLADVNQAAAPARRKPEPSVSGADAELTPVPPIRRAIARRMTRSQTIPQFRLEREIDATRLLADKEALPSPQPGTAKRTINDMLVQALGEAVLRHPELATSYVESEAGEPSFSRRTGGDVGLAVATDRGLVVPVIRRAHERTLGELAADRVRLVGAARSSRLTIDELSGAAVTLSNLGGFGIDRFGALVNPGEAAILAVGRTIERVVPRGRGIVVVPTLSLSLTIDHRVMDGAEGAAVLVDLAELLEGAMTWRP